ncbi:MAG: hypothetical protein RLO48_00405, partial [Bauldia litoralis]
GVKVLDEGDVGIDAFVVRRPPAVEAVDGQQDAVAEFYRARAEIAGSGDMAGLETNLDNLRVGKFAADAVGCPFETGSGEGDALVAQTPDKARGAFA